MIMNTKNETPKRIGPDTFDEALEKLFEEQNCDLRKLIMGEALAIFAMAVAAIALIGWMTGGGV